MVDDPCATCRGVGATTQTRTVNVRVPSGIKDGGTLRVPGKGAPGRSGGPAGDLLVTVHVRRTRSSAARASTSPLTVPITFVEAALGSTITVPTLDGDPVSLKIPAGTPSGRTFRVKGRGLAVKGKQGDLLVTVEVAVPQRVDGKAEQGARRRTPRPPRPTTRAPISSRWPEGSDRPDGLRRLRHRSRLRHLGGRPAHRDAPADPPSVRPASGWSRRSAPREVVAATPRATSSGSARSSSSPARASV